MIRVRTPKPFYWLAAVVVLAIAVGIGLAPYIGIAGANSVADYPTQTAQVERAMKPIDWAEYVYHKRHGIYTDRMADLVPFMANGQVFAALHYGITLEVGQQANIYLAEGAHVHGGEPIITVLHGWGGRDVQFVSDEEAPDKAGAISTRWVSSRPFVIGRGGSVDESTGATDESARGGAAEAHGGEAAHGGGGGEGGGGHGGGGK